MRYRIRLIASDEGYAIGCLDLPGCWSQGAPRDEALRNIRYAIREYLMAQRTLRTENR
jgi:predicted RNase H-like HicB family nuclease